MALAGLVFLIISIRNDTQATRIEQRAWVGVAQWELDREPEDGAAIKVRTTLINQGASPATNVMTKARLSVLAAPIADDWDKVPGTNQAALFPNSTAVGFDKSLTIPVGTAAAYREGRIRIWITGRITYLDAFGRPHWTNFCAYHTPEQNLQLFSLCDSGNDIDREDY